METIEGPDGRMYPVTKVSEPWPWWQFWKRGYRIRRYISDPRSVAYWPVDKLPWDKRDLPVFDD